MRNKQRGKAHWPGSLWSNDFLAFKDFRRRQKGPANQLLAGVALRPWTLRSMFSVLILLPLPPPRKICLGLSGSDAFVKAS